MERKPSFVAVTGVIVFAFAAVAVAEGAARLRDLWVHPRGEAYDPARHYRAPDGELYYHAENDLGVGLEAVEVHPGSEPRVTAVLGADLWKFIEHHGGSLAPVVLFDSNGDGRVDRSLRGGIVEGSAVFVGAGVGDVDWRARRWQMGVRYEAGLHGSAPHDGRYLASVDGATAKVRFPRVDDLPEVAAEPAPEAPALLIFKHREGAPFDLAEMARDPSRYLADFDELTPEKDADDWTVKEPLRGKLRTHLDAEDLFLVRTRGGAALAVEWGDMPLEVFLRERLAAAPDADGCTSTLDSQAVGDDGVKAPVPHRILWCPHASMALFDAPPGYQIGLSALVEDVVFERTEANNGILDNLRLYGREVYPRSPHRRATGTVAGNVRASFADAGRDVVDMGRHLVTGTTRTNLHTGQTEKRTSLLGAVPMLLVGVARLDPVQGGRDFVEGIQSGVQVGADAVSAANNAVVAPVLQVTLGLASPAAADDAGHVTGAVSQAWARNLPGSERSMGALNPLSLWYHDRAFWPTAFTRTDTQLNIDRTLSIANILGAYGIAASAGGSGGGGGGGGGSSGGGGAPAPVPGSVPAPVPPGLPGC